MTTSELVPIILMGVLVIITGIYAWRTHVISKATREQANTSLKMANEMKEQRYDTVRPVIDFGLWESYPVTIQEGLTVKEQEEVNLSSGLQCILHNIGIGPATDVYSFTLTVGGERRQLYLGSLVKGATTPETRLSLEQRGDCWFLVARYWDVYDRSFESNRQVRLDMETGEPLLGRLKIVPVQESKP